ncbi:MAG: DUF5018 domain-containing protein, partial [Flavobacteriaceae bacterium]|nr:DUF5018 domain-containing protein [Flavobacteriaceae bacterium]
MLKQITSIAFVAIMGFLTLGCTEDEILNSESLITELEYLGAEISTTDGMNININLPYGTDISEAYADVEISDGATISPDPDDFIFTSGVSQDFTVTAKDGIHKAIYIIKVTVLQNTEALMSEFTYMDEVREIDEDDTISIDLIYDTTIEDVYSTINISADATISPDPTTTDFVSGEEVDFTVTSQDGNSNTIYTVIVTVLPNTESELTNFVFDVDETNVAAMDDNNIVVTLPKGSTATSITPSFDISTGASSSPETDTEISFEDGVSQDITVTAQDGVTETIYTLTVNITKYTGTELTNFMFNIGDENVAVMDGNDITVTLPAGSTATSITPSFNISTGAISSPVTATSIDFTDGMSQNITVTAQDENVDPETYTLTVNITKYIGTDLTNFVFNVGDENVAVMDGNDITVTLPKGSTIESITPSFDVSTGAISSPLTGTSIDFTDGVSQNITVTAQDENVDPETYTLTVNITKYTGTDLTNFVFNVGESNVAVMQGNSITVTLPAGSTATSITPTFNLSTAASSSKTSGSAIGFTNGVSQSIVVTAEDGTTKETYTLTVNITKYTGTDLTNFVFDVNDANVAIMNGNDITVTLPVGSNATSITPTFNLSTAASSSKTSGSAIGFTDGVSQNITVTAEDGTTKETYTLIVNITKYTGKALSGFDANVTGSASVIDGLDINVTLPAGSST